MTLSRRTRELLAFPLMVIGIPGLVLWGTGWLAMRLGINMWMLCHRLCRDPGCACEECREFDAPLAPPPATTPEPPAAA